MVSEESKTLISLTNLHSQLLKKQDHWLAAHGISYREFLIMLSLHQAPASRMKRIELAEEVGLSASGVTRILNPMEKIGLIGKEEGARDARVSLVRLTEAGERLLQDAIQSFNERAQTFVKSLKSSEVNAIRMLASVKI